MGALGPGKANLTFQTTEARKAAVRKRAERLGWSVSQFGAAIFDAWWNAGRPPVSELETEVVHRGAMTGAKRRKKRIS